MNPHLLSIGIGIDPNVFDVGGFVLTWHGLFTFLAVALGVFLVGRWSKNAGMVPDAIYSVAVWCIIGGIIGTRVTHVIDLWNQVYKHDLVQIFQIWEGGITIYGGILGGFLGGAAYMLIRNNSTFIRLWDRFAGIPSLLTVGIIPRRLDQAPLPSIGRLADLASPALLISMALGRVGDIINGEHFARATSLPWGLTYDHPDVRALYAGNFLSSLSPSHPAVAYELLWDLLVLAMIWPLRGRLKPDGMIFVTYLALYSAGKFFLSFLRLDNVWVLGLREAQFIAIIVLVITVPILVFKAQIVRQREGAGARAGRGE